MTKQPNEVLELLDANLAREAVKSRSQSGTNLSYVDTYYVIKRLNECFGNLGWDSETVDMILVSNPGEKAAYRAKVRITAIVATGDGGYMKVIKEGTGWGSDKSMHNAHEMAAKEAESDALKRAAMKFGMSLGLALYDKSQENVEDSPKQPKLSTPSTPAKAAAALSALKDDTEVMIMVQAPGTHREALNKRITAMSKVVIAKRLKTLEELKADMKTKYGADSTASLADPQAKELLVNLEAMANG
jgi:hypothetical protein